MTATVSAGDGILLRVDHVTKQFGGLTAVKDVSFELPEGLILGIIGPNGAGKTTLFNCINGVYPPTRGQILFRGKRLNGLPTYRIARLGLARTHQIVRPLNELTVLENTMVGACYGRENLSLRQARHVAYEVLNLVGLAGKAHALAGTLNVAQKKRLELARALASRPYLLLLDEVLAGLNPTEVSAMVETIRQIRERGITIIIIEHIMHAIMNLSDHVIVLNYGEMIAQGTPTAIAADPRVIEAYLGNPELAEKLLTADRSAA